MTMAKHPTSDPDTQELRKFGLVFSAGLLVIFGVVLPWLADRPWPKWPWLVAAIVSSAALLVPRALKGFFLLWTKLGHVLGWINTRIILGVIFFTIFAPIALILRLTGKDFLLRRLDATSPSYRINSEKSSRERMEKPY